MITYYLYRKGPNGFDSLINTYDELDEAIEDGEREYDKNGRVHYVVVVVDGKLHDTVFAVGQA